MTARLPKISAELVLPLGLTPLFDALTAAAPQFDFYYTLRRVDAAIPGATALGRASRPRDEPIRLSQHPSLVFAPSTLYTYRPGVAVHGIGRLTVYHFGLFGPNGPMPQHLSEYVHERMLHHKDDTLMRFCDMFQHRFILLFYRAWADCQPALSLDRPERDSFSRYVSSLIGLGQASLRGRDSVPDYLKLHHAGHLARMTRNPEGLVRALSALLGVPVAIQEYCHQWLRLAPQDCTRLGGVAIAGTASTGELEIGANASRLGLGAICGQSVPDVQYKFRLVLGVMGLLQFERFLPTRDRFVQVRDWVRNYIGVEIAWDVRLILHRHEVPATTLGSQGQLGWTSWLGVPAGMRARDADDLVLDMERLSESKLV